MEFKKTLPIGIDLGTTHSLAAYFDDGVTHVIPNSQGQVLTRSAVAVDGKGTVLLGEEAHALWLAQPDRAAVTFKRRMGTQQRLRLGQLQMSAEEASALVLKYLWEASVAFLAARGIGVSGVVITVPAHYGNAQREAVRQAARLAGITLLRLVNEPTAAALAYGLQHAPARSLVIVLDLGGGTFDVSILRCHYGLMEVCASAGDSHLGGEDFVDALISLVLQHWTDLPDRQLTPLLNARLWCEGERVKRQLGAEPVVDFCLEWDGRTRRLPITQAEFAVQAAPLLARLRLPIERVLRDAKLSAGRLHQVVLVGGATRMPLVRQMVARWFHRMPAMNINPDEAVARGAAVLAAMVANDQALDEVMLIDVSPASLSTQVVRTQADGSQRSGYASVLIERNTPLPVSRESRFFTANDHQSQVDIEVRQGEARMAADNILLGTLQVPVPPRPAGEVALDLRFTYDSSGILEVQVTLPEGGQTHQLVVQRGQDGLTEEQVAERLQALASLKVHPRNMPVNQVLKARAERLYEDLLGQQRDHLGDAIDAFDQTLTSQDEARIAPVRQRLQRLLDALRLS